MTKSTAIQKAAEAIAATQRSATENELRERLEYYKAKSSETDAILRTYRQRVASEREQVDAITKAVKAFAPYEMHKYKMSRDSGSRSPVAMVVKTSDWQTGEVIRAAETEGFGDYNWDVEQRRVALLADKVIDDLRMHRDGGFPINEIHVFDEGDPVSGNIHYELEVTNEVPAPVQAVRAGTLHAEFVSRLASHVEHVVIWRITADNHGRLTRKNQWKQGALNNWAYVAHIVGSQALSKHKNVTVNWSEGTSLLANVVGKRFLIKHGHSVKAWMGIPLYGLEREAARESRKRMNTDKSFDYMSIGHYHVPSWMQYMLINGCLSGTTELDHSLGRYAPPAQVSFFVHPKHGIFGYTPWRLT